MATDGSTKESAVITLKTKLQRTSGGKSARGRGVRGIKKGIFEKWISDIRKSNATINNVLRNLHGRRNVFECSI